MLHRLWLRVSSEPGASSPQVPVAQWLFLCAVLQLEQG